MVEWGWGNHQQCAAWCDTGIKSIKYMWEMVAMRPRRPLEQIMEPCVHGKGLAVYLTAVEETLKDLSKESERSELYFTCVFSVPLWC